MWRPTELAPVLLFSFPTHSKAWLRTCARTPLTFFNETPSLLFDNVYRNMHICFWANFFSCMNVSSFHHYISAKKQTPTQQNSNLMEICLLFTFCVFCNQRECRENWSRRTGGLRRLVEMNNSTVSVWVPSASLDLIVAECRVHLAWPSLAGSLCS